MSTKLAKAEWQGIHRSRVVFIFCPEEQKSDVGQVSATRYIHILGEIIFHVTTGSQILERKRRTNQTGPFPISETIKGKLYVVKNPGGNHFLLYSCFMPSSLFAGTDSYLLVHNVFFAKKLLIQHEIRRNRSSSHSAASSRFTNDPAKYVILRHSL